MRLETRVVPAAALAARSHGPHPRSLCTMRPVLMCGLVAALVATSSAGATAPPPILTATDFSPRGAFKAPAFLTNGFLGLRPGPVPLLADPFAGAPAPKAGSFDPTVPATFAGFRYRGVSLHEVPAPGPSPFATAVLVDGRDVLRAADARAVPISQTLDMATGELRTQLELSSGGVTVSLNTTMFVSRTQPTVAAMRVTAAITAGRRGNLSLAPALSLSPASCSAEPAVCAWSAAPTCCSVPATLYNYTIPGADMPGWTAWVWDERAVLLGAVTNIGSKIGLAALPNTTVTGQGSLVYEVLVSVVVDAVAGAHDPVLSAYEHVERAAYLGGHNCHDPAAQSAEGAFAALQRKDRAAWAAVWRARPVVRGPDAVAIAADQRMIDGAFFYMHSHAHPAITMGVCPQIVRGTPRLIPFVLCGVC